MRMVFILVLLTIFLPMCVSTPVNYDTAQIPDGRAPLRVGIGANGFYGTYSVCGGTYRYYGVAVRGDAQVGYGFKRVAEVGMQGGVAVGGYEERPESTTVSVSKANNGREQVTGGANSRVALFQADVYPYIKVGIPGENFRVALKLSGGGGFLVLGSEGSGYPMAYADLLFGLGSPEKLTFGLRVSPVDGLLAIGSLHFGLYTLSVMAVGSPDDYAKIYVGLGLRR